MLEENGAERGSECGPCTAHASLREEEGGMKDLLLLAVWDREGWTSRKADPEAEGITPVCRTVSCQRREKKKGALVKRGHRGKRRGAWGALLARGIQILRSSLALRLRVGRTRAAGPCLSSDPMKDANTGACVPPEGPLLRRLSAIVHLVRR